MIYSVMIVFLAVIFSACTKESEDTVRIPVKIIFDTDMGSDCDDAGALALLHQFENDGKAEIIGCVYSSGKVPYGAGVIEAINIYYNRPDIPVGAYQGNDIGDPLDRMNAELIAGNQDKYGNTIIHNSDAQDLVSLTRKILSEQPDGTVDYITVGHTKGLYDLLVSEPDDISELDGEELISLKVRRWIAMGALNAHKDDTQYHTDYNLMFNGTAEYSDYLLENFPSAVYFVNAGADVMTGKSLQNTPEGNIVRTVYEEWLKKYNNTTLEDQRPSWDLTTVYFAVEDTSRFLEYAPSGYLEFDPEKGSKWVKSTEETNHHLVIQKPGMSQDFADYLNEMIAREPE